MSTKRQSKVDFFCFESQSINESVTTTINIRFSCSSKSVDSVNCRSSCSNFRHLINRRSSCFFESIHSFTFHEFLQLSSSWNVKTSFDKKKNRNHTHIKFHIKSTNNHSKSTSKFSISRLVTFSALSRNLFASFRFVSFSEFVCYNDIQWIRYNDHQKRCFIRFFTFSQSIFSTKMNQLHTAIRKQMTWRKKMKNNNQCKSVKQSIQFVFFTNFCLSVCLSICRQLVNISSQFLQSIRTRRWIKTRKVQIRKIWNNIRSRNRYRFVVFVFVWFWNIDRFIILICKYFRDQNSQQDFHSRDHIFSIFAFLFLFSHLFLYVYRIRFEIFCFNHDQTDIWSIVDEFLRNVDR